MINQKQKDRIKQLIANGCQLKNNNWDDQGQYCIVGELLNASGVDHKKYDPKDLNRNNEVRSLPEDWLKAIRDRFGLTVPELETLQHINDQWPMIEDRRLALCAQLVRIYEHPIPEDACIDTDLLEEDPAQATLDASHS